MAYWNIAATPVTVIPTGVNAPNDYIFQNTGSNTIYISDQQNVTADSTSLAIAAGTPFTWSKSDPLYAVCAANNPSTLFGTANGAQVGTSVSSLLTPTAQYVIAAATVTLYRSTYTLTPGIYTIAVTPNTTIVNIDFYDVNGVLITSVQSTSGSNLTVNLATTAVQFDYWTNSGGAANASISITKSGTNIPYVSGTLTTVTATGTPGLKGDAYIVVIGGGGGGGGALQGSGASGGGGGSGGINFTRKVLLGTENVTIGAGGNGGIGASSPTGVTGGTTSFAGISATGGTGGGQGSTGLAGTPNGAAGGAIYGNNGVSTSTLATLFTAFFTEGSTGGGGAGGVPSGGGGGGGGGSGIGTGGAGGTGGTGVGINGGNATGYGAGGGGAGGDSAASKNGGNGSQGICYIII